MKSQRQRVTEATTGKELVPLRKFYNYFTPSHPVRVSREGTIFSNPDVVLAGNTLMHEFQTFRNVRNEFLLFIICLTQCSSSPCLLYHISAVQPLKDCIIFHYMCIPHCVYSIVKKYSNFFSLLATLKNAATKILVLF